MDIHSYQSFEEPRTANSQNTAIKSVQSWKNPKTPAQNEIIAGLNNAADNRTAKFQTTLMGYAPQQITAEDHAQKSDSFQFNDVIDIINPLHHLPIVGTVYRNLTGDELHPMSGIIGGAAYGGPIGAVTGTINAISKIQTGKDFTEHALSIMKPAENKVAKEITMTKEMDSINRTIENNYIDDITTLKLAAMPPRQS